MSSAKNKNKQRKKASVKNEPETEDMEEVDIECQEERFERELTWCIDQIQLGLETQSPDSRQAAEAMKILRILKSSKAPMIKKRQAMRTTFGDYRSKMKDMEQKSATAARRVKLSSAPQTQISKSVFFRKRSEANAQSTATNPNGQTNNSAVSQPPGSFTFQFNVAAENRAGTSVMDSMDVDTASGSSSNCGSTGVSADRDSSNSRQTDSFKLEKSDNTFRFHFPSPDS